MKALRRVLYFLTSRLFVTSLLIVLQILAIIIPFILVGATSVYIHTIISILSLIFAVGISSSTRFAPFHFIWVILLLAAPIAGWPLYIILRHNQEASKASKRCDSISRRLDAVPIGGLSPKELHVCQSHPFRRQMYFLANAGNAPIYSQTETHYFPNGETFYPVYLEKLRTAKKFIFLEYFIINDGFFWQQIRSILAEKCAQGVTVRILHDDLANIGRLNRAFTRDLQKLGIEIFAFNPYRAAVNSFMNYRDHRKITVIDGEIAFTGGINLSDEYINAVERFGHWKDCAVMLEGDAVAALTQAFLKSWSFAVKEECDIKPFLTATTHASDGLVQPYADSPTDDLRVGRDTYHTLIGGAHNYVWITAPYLILEESMLDELCLAASSGIDVRIITPHIPDKSYVHIVTRSNYEPLLRAGVRVFEYTPGFVHAKTIVADDAVCMVGSTNFDYRSFYSLFENGVLLYGTNAVQQLHDDFLDTQAQSGEVTLNDCILRSPFKRAIRAVLRSFSPFM